MTSTAGCYFVAPDFLRCKFNAFEILKRSVATITTKILSMKDRFNRPFYYYNMPVWPALEELHTQMAIYPCVKGRCVTPNRHIRPTSSTELINDNATTQCVEEVTTNFTTTAASLEYNVSTTAASLKYNTSTSSDVTHTDVTRTDEITINPMLTMNDSLLVESTWFKIIIILIVVIVVVLIIIFIFLKRKRVFRRHNVTVKPMPNAAIFQINDDDDDDEDNELFGLPSTHCRPTSVSMNTTPKEIVSPIPTDRFVSLSAAALNNADLDSTNVLVEVDIHNVNSVVVETSNLTDSVLLPTVNPHDVLSIINEDQAVPDVISSSSSTISLSLTNVSSIKTDDSDASTIDPNLSEN